MTKPSYPKPYLEFIRLFNAQKFFEAHEVLEMLWRAEKGRPRDFYHGLIQIAAAFVHIQKGTPEGAQKLFQKSGRYLEKYLPSCQGLNLKQFLEDVQAALYESGQFPKITLN